MTAVWQAETTTPEPVPPVAESRAGDFVDLYRSHYPRLVSSLRLSGAAADAPDIAQEAFARTFRHWRRVRTGANPRGYVTTVAFRLLRRRHDLSDAPPLLDSDLTVGSHEPAVVARAGLDRALDVMPRRRRACAALCLFLDVSVDDAAGALGISPSTVRVQLHWARRDLRAALGQPVAD